MHSLWLVGALWIGQGSTPGPVDFPDLGLKVTLPALEGHQQRLGTVGEQVRATWSGRLGAGDATIVLYLFPVQKWGLHEAGGVTEVMTDWLREEHDFDVEESFEHEGPFGYAPVLSVVSGAIREETRFVGREYAASGLLKDHGYSFHVRVRPEPDEAARAALARFFETGIVYTGPVRDPAWSEVEVVERWKRAVPEELHADFERNLSKKAWVKNAILRTEHYLVLTNASGGKKFAEQMEKNYDAIGRIFPLPSGKGCRLMPVFLFQMPEEYHAFCEKRGMTAEAAKRSKGHASGDYYATWYESPTDPTHIHEQTHQIFGNRLFLGGGGSWFQEGVAEYVESSRNDRNVIASQVAKGKHLPLVEFFERKSLLWSSAESRKEGGSEASDLYTQAGLFIEFLRESKWGRERFPRFLQTVGRVPRSLEKVRLAFLVVYGATVEEVDAEFQAYCAER